MKNPHYLDGIFKQNKILSGQLHKFMTPQTAYRTSRLIEGLNLRSSASHLKSMDLFARSESSVRLADTIRKVGVYDFNPSYISALSRLDLNSMGGSILNSKLADILSQFSSPMAQKQFNSLFLTYSAGNIFRKQSTLMGQINKLMEVARWSSFTTEHFDQLCDQFENGIEPKKPDENNNNLLLESVIPENIRQNLIETRFFGLRLMRRILTKPEEMQNIDHRQFEELIAELVHQLGYDDVVLTPRSDDNGRDVMCVLSSPTLPILHAIECKQWAPTRKVGKKEVTLLLGAINMHRAPAAVGVIAATSGFTKGALKVAAEETRIGTKDLDQIIADWINPVRYGSSH